MLEGNSVDHLVDLGRVTRTASYTGIGLGGF